MVTIDGLPSLRKSAFCLLAAVQDSDRRAQFMRNLSGQFLGIAFDLALVLAHHKHDHVRDAARPVSLTFGCLRYSGEIFAFGHLALAAPRSVGCLRTNRPWLACFRHAYALAAETPSFLAIARPFNLGLPLRPFE